MSSKFEVGMARLKRVRRPEEELRAVVFVTLLVASFVAGLMMSVLLLVFGPLGN